MSEWNVIHENFHTDLACSQRERERDSKQKEEKTSAINLHLKLAKATTTKTNNKVSKLGMVKTYVTGKLLIDWPLDSTNVLLGLLGQFDDFLPKRHPAEFLCTESVENVQILPSSGFIWLSDDDLHKEVLMFCCCCFVVVAVFVVVVVVLLVS